jgi:hypothetical protein
MVLGGGSSSSDVSLSTHAQKFMYKHQVNRTVTPVYNKTVPGNKLELLF